MTPAHISIVIIDDSIDNLQLLERKIGLCKMPVKVTGAFSDPEAALAAILATPPQIVITDIEMPGLNGFELISEIRPLKIPVIITSAFESYALKAIKFSAVDYLLKPVDLEDLRQSLQKVIVNQNAPHYEASQEFISQNASYNNNIFERIVINTQEKAYIMSIADIIIVEAQQSYSQISDLNGNSVTSSKPIQYYEELLKDHLFFRSHRSYLINTRHVIQVDKDGKILMRNGFKALVNKEHNSTLISNLGKR